MTAKSRDFSVAATDANQSLQSNPRNSIDSFVYSSFSNNNIPRQQGPGSIASSSYSNFGKQNFGSGPYNKNWQNSDNPYNAAPLSSFAGYSSYGAKFAESARSTTRLLKFRVPIFFKRILKPPTLDFDKSIWEAFYLIFSPKKVYKSLYYHKYTKNYYHRDDPSFIILISFFLVISAIAWGITYSLKFLGILKLILYMVIVDFYLVGIVVATINWVLVNRFLRKNNYLSQLYGGANFSSYTHAAPNSSKIVSLFQFVSYKIGSLFSGSYGGSNRLDASVSSSSEETLEWAYCFDIHANSFLIIWINLYLLQFILLPILVLNSFFSRLLGNSLYLVTFSYYCVNSFYGYNILPFLVKTEFILIPIPIFIVAWFILTFCGFNMTSYMVDSYFN